MTAQTRTDDELLARQLWAIGDIVRLRLLSFLPTDENCESGNNVSRLAEKLELSQPTVSHHLRVLRQAGLVRNRKMCRDVFYWVDPEEADRVCNALRETFEVCRKRSTQAKASPLSDTESTGEA